MPTSTRPRLAPSLPRPIADLARDLGLAEAEWVPYGRDMAKVLLPALEAHLDPAPTRR